MLVPEYRYRLNRLLPMCNLFAAESRYVCLFIMLNPSTATATMDDPTIRRCMGFAKSWDMVRLEVVNLFAARATKPADLKQFDDPVGPNNDGEIINALWDADRIICAWGTNGSYRHRDREVIKLVREHGRVPAEALGLTAGGHPRHPLYLPASAKPFQIP